MKTQVSPSGRSIEPILMLVYKNSVNQEPFFWAIDCLNPLSLRNVMVTQSTQVSIFSKFPSTRSFITRALYDGWVREKVEKKVEQYEMRERKGEK